MSHQSENELIVKAVKWAIMSSAAVFKAGGAPELINKLPDDLLSTMVRNNLVLKYEKP